MEADFTKTPGLLPRGCAIACVHGCGELSDVVIQTATETTEHNSIELAVCSPSQEPVQLDQKSCVWVLAVGRGLLDLSELVVLNVNTHVD